MLLSPAVAPGLATAAGSCARPDWARLATPAVLLALAVHAAISSCDHDEIEHLHAAWLLGQGALPFRDFLEHHSPAYWFLAAPLTRVAAGDARALITAARWLNLLALAWALRSVARFTGGSGRWCSPALLLLGSWFELRNSIEARPDALMSALCTAGLCAWLQHRRDGRPHGALRAGLYIGAAIVLCVKAAPFAALMLAGGLLAARLDRALNPFLESALLFLAATAIPVVIGALLLQRAGLWSGFLFWNVTFNRYAYLVADVEGVSPWTTLRMAWLDQPLLWSMGLFAAMGPLLRFARTRAAEPEELTCAAIALGLLVALCRSAFPYSHNLLLIAPPLALLAGRRLERLGWDQRFSVQLISGLSIAKCLVLCAVYQENAGHREVQEWILARSGPEDRIYAPPPFHPIFRSDSSYFWFDARLKKQLLKDMCRAPWCAALLERDEQRWAANPPALIYLPPGDRSAWPLEWPAISGRYVPDGSMPGAYRLREPANRAQAVSAFSPPQRQ